MDVSINLIAGDARIHVDVLTLSDGRRFASLRLGSDVSIILPGFDVEVRDFMRKIVVAFGIAEAEMAAIEKELHPDLAPQSAEPMPQEMV